MDLIDNQMIAYAAVTAALTFALASTQLIELFRSLERRAVAADQIRRIIR